MYTETGISTILIFVISLYRCGFEFALKETLYLYFGKIIPLWFSVVQR